MKASLHKRKRGLKFKTSLVLALVMGVVFTPIASASVEGIKDQWNGMLDGIESSLKGNPLQTLREDMLKNYSLLINPYFKAGFDFVSNTFRTPGDGREDVIWKFTPGFNATYNHDYGEIGISYEADFNYFSKHASQNEQDQRFSTYTDIYPTDNLSLSVSHELSQTGATGGAPGLEPLNYRDNLTNVVVAYLWNELLGEMTYQFFDREYNGKIFDRFSYHENLWTFYVYHDVNEDLRANLGYEVGFISYDETPGRNTEWHEIALGAEGTLPADIKYFARTAFHIRKLNLSDFNDAWWIVGSLNLSKEITEQTTGNIGFERGPAETTFGTTNYYDQKTIYANLNHRFNDTVRGKTFIDFANRDFEDSSTVGAVTAKRDDDVLGIGLKVDWAARRWLVFNLGYRYERRNSNISAFDYTDHKLSTGVTIPM